MSQVVTAKSVHDALSRGWESSSVWQKKLGGLSGAELHTLLTELSQNIFRDHAAWERLSTWIPLEKLEGAIRSANPDFTTAIEELENLLSLVKHYVRREVTLAIAPTLERQISRIIDSFSSLLEAVIEVFGAGTLFKQAEGEFEKEMKSSRLMMLFSLFSMLVMTLTPIVGGAEISMVLGSTMLGIFILSVIFPYIKPAPRGLPLGENWTRMLQDNKLEAVYGRKLCLDEIARTLQASERVKEHPLLVGPSGIGKTETVKAFALAVERGDYPELQGKQVIYFNTSIVANHREFLAGANKVLRTIREAMGPYKDRYILIFDEIHNAMGEESLAEELKTLLDPGEQGFPYFIGITTDEEYASHVAENKAFDRRFRKISVESASKEETVEILQGTLRQQAKHLLVEEGAFSYLVEKLKDKPQPITAQKVLFSCIHAASPRQSQELESKIKEVGAKMEAALTKARSEPFLAMAKQGKEVAEMEKSLEALEKQLAIRQKTIDALFGKMVVLSTCKTEVMKKVALLFKKNIPSLAEQSLLLLQQAYRLPPLEEKIRQEASKLQVRVTIDKALIDDQLVKIT